MATTPTTERMPPTVADAPRPPRPATARRRRRGWGRLVGGIAALATAAGLALAFGYDPRDLYEAWNRPAPEAHASGPVPRPAPRPDAPWDGLVRLAPEAVEAIGLQVVEALPQAEPIRLKLLGKTSYRTELTHRVRPMFKVRVDRVHVSIGQEVRKGEPLLDLYSTELALAKNDFRVKQIQWKFDRQILENRSELIRTDAISRQAYEETRLNEMRSRLEYQVARDTLKLYGLDDAEIEDIDAQEGAEKARLTLRSPIDGVVIEREAAPGNLYDDDDALLTVAPIDKLWVLGQVFESDLELVEVGRNWEIEFPFLDLRINSTIEYVSNRVDPETHAVEIRSTIDNSNGRLKSDMLVRGDVEIPPAEGRVVIPRTALVVTGLDDHVFVLVGEGDEHAFERRVVGVVQEKEDRVVLDSGVRPGERVAAVGSLILSQQYLERSRSSNPVRESAAVLAD